MSRSFRHTPRCGDRKSRFAKRLANRTARRRIFRADERRAIPPHMGYKRAFSRYNICDYERLRTTWNEYVREEQYYCGLCGRPLPSLREMKRKYKKRYINK